ncbi:MAG: hypothetical protein ACLPJW_21100 [Rhodomicrobium sp.]
MATFNSEHLEAEYELAIEAKRKLTGTNNIPSQKNIKIAALIIEASPKYREKSYISKHQACWCLLLTNHKANIELVSICVSRSVNPDYGNLPCRIQG